MHYITLIREIDSVQYVGRCFNPMFEYIVLASKFDCIAHQGRLPKLAAHLSCSFVFGNINRRSVASNIYGLRSSIGDKTEASQLHNLLALRNLAECVRVAVVLCPE